MASDKLGSSRNLRWQTEANAEPLLVKSSVLMDYESSLKKKYLKKKVLGKLTTAKILWKQPEKKNLMAPVFRKRLLKVIHF